MSNVFTLESLREAAEKKFGGVKIELDETRTVRLRNLFQLSKDEKKEILDKLDDLADIQDAAEKYTSYQKSVAEIAKLEDITDDEREAKVAELGEAPATPDDDEMDEMFTIIRQVLKVAADNHGGALVRELATDDTITITLFEEWMKSAQVGEAEHSPTS